MEVGCGVVSRQSPVCFSVCSASCSKELNGSGLVSMGRRRTVGGGGAVMMSDQSHLQYYGGKPNCVVTAKSSEKMVVDKSLKKLKKKKKVQLKLLKGLSKDLSTFSQIGFGLDVSGDLADQVQGNMISEATEVLLKQLQKLRADEKELKRRKKEEKAHSKAIRMQNRAIDCEMSSSASSSSSSSDSECGEVVNMKSLKLAQTNLKALQSVVEVEASMPPTTPVIPVLPISEPVVSEAVQVAVLATAPVAEERIAVQSSCVGVSENIRNSPDAPTASNKIEVCMGGKCKKSGAAELLDRFQQAVGIQGAVSSCKCMGKCRNAPAVKVVNGELEDSSVRSPSNNAVCIGVSLDDVDTIVANFLGENQNQQLQLAA